MHPLLPISGCAELENGKVIKWLLFATNEIAAIRTMTVQLPHVVKCWVVKDE